MKAHVAILLLFTAITSAGTIDFSEVPLPNITPVTNQFAAYGINLQNAYLYHDERDMFDGVGVSILYAGPAVILFSNPLSTLSIDYWVITGAYGTYSIFDGAHALLDSFTVDATGGNDLLGSHAFTGSGIAQLEYSGTQGMIQVSTLRFNGTEVPEPATWALIVGGFAALAIRRLRQTG